jgi:hypothetical protein
MFRLVAVAVLVFVPSAFAQSFAPRWTDPPDSTPAPGVYLAPNIPPNLKLLAQPSVQTDLGLSPQQKADVAALHKAIDLPAWAWEAASLGWITAELGTRIASDRARQYLVTGLTREQRNRLDQIAFQLREREFGAHAAFAMAARNLALRPDQLEDVQYLKGLRVQEIAKHVTSSDRFERVKDRVTATNTDTFDKMAEMLTRTQRERLTALKGQPFTGSIEAAEPPVARTKGPAFRYPERLFGAYDFELRYLDSGAVWTEVGIKEDQRASIARALREWEATYLLVKDGPIQNVAGLHDVTAKALDAILTADQRQRFDELMARRRREAGGPEAACGYPPVVSALKLSPIQLAALNEGETVANVLTKAQYDAFEKVFGKAPESSPSVADPIMEKARAAQEKQGAVLPFRQPGSVAFASSFLLIADRLRLSAEQIKKLRELAEDEPKMLELIQRELSLADTPPVVGAGRNLTSAGRVIDWYKTALEEQCWTVLDPQQQSLARKLFGVKR